MSSRWRRAAFAVVMAVVTLALGPTARAQPHPRIFVQSPLCGDAWSESRFIDILRVELQPFAALVREGVQRDMQLTLSGDCVARVYVEIEGHSGSSFVSLEDVPEARERTVAMAIARLVELSLSEVPAENDAPADTPAHDAPAHDAPGDDDPVGEVPELVFSLARVPQEGGVGLPAPAPFSAGSGPEPPTPESTRVPRDGVAEPRDRRIEARRSSTPGSYLSVGPSLLWLPDGGASFGLDADVAPALRGPFFVVVGAGFTQSRSDFERGVVRLVRLEATAGVGVRWERRPWGLEGRLLGRGGWIRLGGESSGARVSIQTRDALSLGIQLDAGVAMQFGRVSVVLRGGPFLILNGLTAESTSPDQPQSYVSFSGLSLVASASLRVAL